jgi:hypothetical protein
VLLTVNSVCEKPLYHDQLRSDGDLTVRRPTVSEVDLGKCQEPRFNPKTQLGTKAKAL